MLRQGQTFVAAAGDCPSDHVSEPVYAEARQFMRRVERDRPPDCKEACLHALQRATHMPDPSEAGETSGRSPARSGQRRQHQHSSICFNVQGSRRLTGSGRRKKDTSRRWCEAWGASPVARAIADRHPVFLNDGRFDFETRELPRAGALCGAVNF